MLRSSPRRTLEAIVSPIALIVAVVASDLKQRYVAKRVQSKSIKLELLASHDF
jgi:hypothetical protein